VASGFSRTIRALVLELVEGPTLADRIAQGPIPLEEALPIARQIAEALEAAHDKGVIHRDLKPANIKLRLDGTVKVLDFGLAKLAGPAEAGHYERDRGVRLQPDLTASPTITTPAMTGVGVILGTAAYMAPEQARGKAVDKRADVWAFGCVLYEMLTGRRVFDAEDLTDTIAAVVRAEPDWSRLSPDTPPSIRRLLRRCLKKDVRERLPEIGTARIEIGDAHTEATDGVDRAAAHRGTASVLSRRERLVWASAALLLAGVATALGIVAWRSSAAAPEAEMRFEISTPRTNNPRSFALSPDGRHLVFSAVGDDGQSRLWLRSLDAGAARALTGTETAEYPFWSPDSRSVAFFASDRLERIDIGGGPPQIITDAPGQGRGGTWNSDGVILFAVFAQNGNGLLRVAASGGERRMVTPLRNGQTDRFPYFLPDGDHFLFLTRAIAVAPERASEIRLGSLSTGETWRLTASDTSGLYLRGGWMLFSREGTLLAQRLDVSRRELTGDPATVAEDVHYDTNVNAAAVSVSASGAVAYRTGTAGRRQLRWFDRAGKDVGMMGPIDDNNLSSVELSPDGRRVATYRNIMGNSDVWVFDNDRMTRFTFGEYNDLFPIWSSDGRQIVFDSNRSGYRDLYRKSSRGAGNEQLLIDMPRGDKAANDFSRDDRFLLFSNVDPMADWDIWVLPLEGDGKPSAFIDTNFDERSSQFSPDGRWVAYISNESGRYEVYVRPFPASGGQWQISTSGGAQPRWSPRGRELFYIAPDATLMAVPIGTNSDAIEPGTPLPLFQTRIWNASPLNRTHYDVAPDGRFLINVAVDQNSLSPITLLLNWNPERAN
jgi:Tol biopolymer transport system component